MNRFFRILTAATLVLGLVELFSTVTTFAQTPAGVQAVSQSTGVVSGNIHDTGGAPVSNVTVRLAGAQMLTSRADVQGNFTFSSVTPGIYAFTATKAGYNTATETNVTVLGGQRQTLAVTMSALSFSSLRTIATVRATGRGTFNTTPASVNVVSSQTFADQAQPQVMKVLNETPGVVASLPQTSANGAAPGAITFPNIRGALSFETASLVDGHPVSVGAYGDYVTTFLNPFMLENIELVKGPGADAPQVNYAIGGTVNFRSKEPTYETSGMWQVGADNWGSSIVNFGFSDTVGRLGFVLAFGSNDLESNVSGTSTWVSPQAPQQGVLNFNGATGTGVGFNDGFPAPTIPGTISSNTNTNYLVACCEKIDHDLYQNKSELAKLRYKFSRATLLTFTYMGSQTWANQAANTGDVTHSTFTLTGSGASAGQIGSYTGSLANNSPLDVGYVRTPEHEINNEPILEGDLRTTIDNDTLQARYYSAGIHRLLYQGSNSPFVPTVLNMQLYGYDSATKTVYNGQTMPVTFFDYYNQAENDALKGYSFQYDHPFANGADALTFAVDTTHSTTTAYSVGVSGPGAGKAFNTSQLKPTMSITLPTGSAQDFSTAMLRGVFNLSPKLSATITNYFNIYKSTYPTLCTGTCSFDGTGFSFGTTTRNHYDPRLALELRPNGSTAVRLSAGSAIAPPYLALLSGISQPISYSSQTQIATERVNAGTLQPETAFGYDLGGDYRFHDGVTIVSADLYYENLFNHFMNTTYNSGLRCPALDPVTGANTNCPSNTPLFYQSNINLANARFEGVELQVRRNPSAGFGYTLQGALQRGYAYNLPACFYSTAFKNGVQQCGTYGTNLAVIPGANFTGGGISGNGLSPNALSNQNVPYAQGYGELNYRTPGGWYGNVNWTYYGHNNSLDEPAFGVLGATLRAPLPSGMSFQISGDNLTNMYSGVWPVYGAGSPIPLAGPVYGSKGNLLPSAAATQANVLFPRTIRLLFTKSFGPGVTPNR